MFSTLVALAVLGAALWLWRDSLRARELAARVSRRACDAEGLQFLDDTVSLAALRPVMAHGRPQLRRVYEFEFSRDGYARETGSVTVTGARLETVYVGVSGGAPPPGDPRRQQVVALRPERRHD